MNRRSLVLAAVPLTALALAGPALASAPAAHVTGPSRIVARSSVKIAASGLRPARVYVVRVTARGAATKICVPSFSARSFSNRLGVLRVTLGLTRSEVWCSGRAYQGTVGRPGRRAVATFRFRVAAAIAPPGAAQPVDGSAVKSADCPVPTNTACPITPLAGAAVVALDSSGAQVGSATSTATGSFQLSLPAGRYTFVGGPIAGLVAPLPVAVVVAAGHGTPLVKLLYRTRNTHV